MGTAALALRPRRAALIIPAPAAAHVSPVLVVIAALVAVAALAVITASVRITDRAVARAVEAREAPVRFLTEELVALRLLAMTSASVVPGRLYLGIEECFRRDAPVPFDAHAARHSLAACAESELGRLHAQGGAELESRGRQFLAQAAVDHLSARVKLAAGNFERR